MKKETLNFNKELLFGEIGALIGAPLIAFIVSHFSESSNLISSSAVIGGLVGASAVWITTRTWDQKCDNKNYSFCHLAHDLAYFTPAALIITILVYYPSLFFLSKHMITQEYKVLSSIIASQITAFSLFLITINVYRYSLKKLKGKIL